MDGNAVDQIWGPDNPIVATWPASVIPTAIAILFVVFCLAKPSLARRVISRDSMVMIVCLYVVVFVLGNMLFLLTRITFEERILNAMGSCDVRCLPIQEGWQSLSRSLAWAMFIVPSFMLSPFILYLAGDYVRRRRLQRNGSRATGN